MGKQSEGKGVEIFGAITHLLLVIGMIISLSIHNNRIANAPMDPGVDVAVTAATGTRTDESTTGSGNSDETVISAETAAKETTEVSAFEAGKSSDTTNESAADVVSDTDVKLDDKTDVKTETDDKTDDKTEEKTDTKTDTETDTGTKDENKSENRTESKTDSETKTDAKSDEKADQNVDQKSDQQKQDQKQQDQKTEKKKDKSTSKGSSSKNSILQDIITGYVGFRIWDHVEYIDDMTVYHLKDTTEFDPGFYKDLYGDVLGEHGFVSYEDMLKHYEQYGREELRFTTKESYEAMTESQEKTSDQSENDDNKKKTEVVTEVYEFVISSVSYDKKACSDYSCNMNNGQPVRVAYELTYQIDSGGQRQELLSAKLATGEPAGFGMTLNFGTAGDAVTFSWVTFNSLTNGKTPTGTGTGSINGVTTSGKPVQVTFLYRML